MKIEFIELEVLTYLKEDMPEIDYESLGIVKPEEDVPLSWQRRYFNTKLLAEEVISIFSEKEGETVLKYFNENSMIVKGDLHEILNKLT